MRVTIFDDDGNELAQAWVTELKLDTRTQQVEISAGIIAAWHSLNEGGGQSAKAAADSLMAHIVSTRKSQIVYTRSPAAAMARNVSVTAEMLGLGN